MLASSDVRPLTRRVRRVDSCGGEGEEKGELASGKQGAEQQHVHTGGRRDVTFRTSSQAAKFVHLYVDGGTRSVPSSGQMKSLYSLFVTSIKGPLVSPGSWTHWCV